MRVELDREDLEAIAEAAAARVVVALRPLLVTAQVDADRLMTIEETSECLGVTAQWLYKRTSLGEIPHRKLGRFLKFSRRELDAWIEREGRMPQVADLTGKLKVAK